MSNELTYSAAFTFQKGNLKELTETFIGFVQNIAGTVSIHNNISVGATEEAIQLGEVTAAKAFIVIHNQDDTNYVEFRDATGASNDVVYIPARGVVMFFMGTDVTAPYLIANTAACLVEYWIIPD
jgi:hypothetical protein